MNAGNPLKKSHRKRSCSVRALVQQRSSGPTVACSVFAGKPPKRIVQFWDDLGRLPCDMGECIETGRTLTEADVERLLLDKY